MTPAESADISQNENALSWRDSVIFPIYVAWDPKLNIQKQQPAWVRCSCINFTKVTLGITDEVWGYPNLMQATSANPYVGGLVLTKESKWGHVAVITATTETTITVVESNHTPCAITTRTIPLSSGIIRGFR